jgi:ribosome-binding protein aMBF1 (putative translation factor)
MEIARRAKGWKQADLARASSVDLNIIKDLESGTKEPDQQQFGKIEGKLGVSLRGETFGQPKTYGPKNKAKGAAEKKGKEKE